MSVTSIDKLADHLQGSQMLEDIAIQYVVENETNLGLATNATIFAGAIGAAIFHRSSAELQRAPYFAKMGALFLIFAASRLIWLGLFPAMIGGFLWVLVLADAVVCFGHGYAVVVIAKARSRDAFGHARMAFLAFVPIANLYLHFTPSKNDVSANRAPTNRLMTGDLGVLTGTVLVVASVALGAFVRSETNRAAAEAVNDPVMRRAYIDMMVRGQGLEVTLLRMAAEVQSQRVDDTTELVRALGDGATLRYIYEVSINMQGLPVSLQTGLAQHDCSHGGLRPLLDAGATIEHVYRRDGSEIGTVTVARDVCNP